VFSSIVALGLGSRSNGHSNGCWWHHPKIGMQRGINGQDNCEENAEALGGFVNDHGRGGKMNYNQNQRWRKGEWGMVHSGAEMCH
jgi:hypothetical protein